MLSPDPAPDSFRPARWCHGGHAQTIAAALLAPLLQPPACRERWDTPDGDFLDIDALDAPAGKPTLVVLHGLEGSSRAKPVRAFLHFAHRRGWRAYAVNFRSCSGEPNRLDRIYHSGETSDLDYVLRTITKRHPGDPLFVVGISLGGNVLLKYLGETGEAAPAALKAAAAISTPFDLAASALAFEQDFWSRIYMGRLVASLKRKTRRSFTRRPSLDLGRLAAVRTIREFDALVTAPLNGFADAEDYWRRCSCRQFLPQIRKPVLLISAQDDPLVPAGGLPIREAHANPALITVFPESGGHVGFVGGNGPGAPFFWAQETVLRFFERLPG